MSRRGAHNRAILWASVPVLLLAHARASGRTDPTSGPVANPVGSVEIEPAITVIDPLPAADDIAATHSPSGATPARNDSESNTSTPQDAASADTPPLTPPFEPTSKPAAEARSEQESRPLGASSASARDRAEQATLGASGKRSPGVGSGGSGGGGGWIKQTGAALGVVLALILLARFGLVALARRTGGLAAMLGAGGRAPSGVMEILARYPVSRGHTLVLLKVDRRVLVLCHTSQGFTTLTEFVEPEEVASILMRVRDEEGESMAARFNDLLRQMSDAPDDADTDGPVSPRMVLAPTTGRTVADWPPRAGAAS